MPSENPKSPIPVDFQQLVTEAYVDIKVGRVADGPETVRQLREELKARQG